ncbi:MAG: hypothetical protein MUD14_21910 [Hydrococcus sp. Prado102]|jgi:hypothetical protein|nr:hypothetical protein [Hydrococcus sp. Prado102]
MSEQFNPSKAPCPICGNRQFSWGRTVDSQGGWLYSRENMAGLGGGESLIIRKCFSCKNVQLFTQELAFTQVLEID